MPPASGQAQRADLPVAPVPPMALHQAARVPTDDLVLAKATGQESGSDGGLAQVNWPMRRAHPSPYDQARAHLRQRSEHERHTARHTMAARGA